MARKLRGCSINYKCHFRIRTQKGRFRCALATTQFHTFAVLCNPQKNSCPDLLEGMEIYYTFADTYRLNEGRKL